MKKMKKAELTNYNLISLGLIFSSAGLVFFILSVLNGLESFIIMAVCLLMLGVIMMAYYVALLKKRK